MTLTPVTLPPGRLKLDTRPSATGFGAATEDDRDRRGRCFGCKRRLRGERRRDDGDMTVNKVSRHFRQPVELALGPTVFDRDVLPLDVSASL